MGRKISTSAYAALVLCGCGGSPRMRYVRPRVWESIFIPPSSGVSDQSVNGATSDINLARYQIEECERIAMAYAQLSRNRDATGRTLDITAPVITGAGAVIAGAATIAGAGQTMGSDQTSVHVLQAVGLGTTLIGAGISAANAGWGHSQSDYFSKAAEKTTEVTDEFRVYLRERASSASDAGEEAGDAGVDPRAHNDFLARLCLLRQTCHRFYSGTRLVADPFDIPRNCVGDATCQSRMVASQAVQRDLTAKCGATIEPVLGVAPGVVENSR
jgi:hypothetical protein